MEVIGKVVLTDPKPEKDNTAQEFCSCKKRFAGVISPKDVGKKTPDCFDCGKPIKPKPAPVEIEELRYKEDLYLEGNIQNCVDKVNEIIRELKRTREQR